jgi:hypothetical protein
VDYKTQAITAPICNARRVATCKFIAFSFTAKSFDLAFTTKFKNKIQKFGSMRIYNDITISFPHAT